VYKRQFNSLAVGPGLGTDEPTANALKLLIQTFPHPLILDADALNILAENKTWLAFLPKGSILTPHPREFERMAGNCADSLERMEKQREMSQRFGIYVILKGAHSSISTPDGIIYFNTTGNPGMATGGSGDVLTGILLGIRAQGYTPLETALLGTYLHGFAADLALEESAWESLLPSDITAFLGSAFQLLREA
jgi:NAD(P)H-hydrate epimerase